MDGIRQHASYFALSNKKEENEIGVILTLNEELERLGKMPFHSFKLRGQGNDPPDCEATDDDGRRIGIEVTELVDGTAIAAAREGNFIWQDPPEVQAAFTPLILVIFVTGFFVWFIFTAPPWVYRQIVKTLPKTKFSDVDIEFLVEETLDMADSMLTGGLVFNHDFMKQIASLESALLDFDIQIPNCPKNRDDLIQWYNYLNNLRRYVMRGDLDAARKLSRVDK